MAMPREGWEHLRSEINRRRRLNPDRPLARCRLCEGGVFIRAQAVGNDRIPLYAHFPESSRSCPWYEGSTIKLDDARAAQYQGHQESALHRYLCQTIEILAKTDSRCRHSAVNTYLRSEIHERGRWPDVFLDMGELGRFALEIQLSKPFAPEIVARHIHYELEGVHLIWIFHNLEDPLPQGFRDVITMQRGNAFTIDDDAIAESCERNTLMLNCFLEDERGGYLKPRLVALDDLDTTSGRSVFLKDRRSERLQRLCRDGRKRWWNALIKARAANPDYPFNNESFAPAWASLRAYIPELSDWREDFWAVHLEKGRPHLAMLFSILCSVAHSAKEGTDTLYITRYSGDGALLAMLNSKLSAATFAPYADLIEMFLANTARSELLQRSSLRKCLAIARGSMTQIGPDHPVWRAMALLFPEALNGLVRAEMQDLARLPKWAGGLTAANPEA